MNEISKLLASDAVFGSKEPDKNGTQSLKSFSLSVETPANEQNSGTGEPDKNNSQDSNLSSRRKSVKFIHETSKCKTHKPKVLHCGLESRDHQPYLRRRKYQILIQPTRVTSE